MGNANTLFPEPSSSLPLSCAELAKQRDEEGVSGTGFAEVELGWLQDHRGLRFPSPGHRRELRALTEPASLGQCGPHILPGAR